MKRWIKDHSIALAIIASVLLHLVLLALFGLSRQWMVITAAVAQPKPAPDPIVFDLIETPDESSRRPEEAKHASDKDFSARNPTAPENPPTSETYSAGDTPRGEFPVPAAPLRSPAPQRRAAAAREAGRRPQDGLGNLASQEFRRELLVDNRSPQAKAQSSPMPSRSVYDNRQSRAPELGSFAINTYAWDYAPYLLWLKRRIEQNIYPPPAFTRLGMISGQSVLRFRIYPDGRLEELQVLKTAGHKSLMETSVKAIELSVPLKPLPDDFPEPYLEVTALFEYLVQGR